MADGTQPCLCLIILESCWQLDCRSCALVQFRSTACHSRKIYRMSPHNCPNCHEPTISFWRKQFLGPARSIRCSNCSARISVDWKMSLLIAALMILHFVVITVVALEGWGRFGLLFAFAAVIVVSLLFCVLLGFIQDKFVRLVVRDR